MSTQKNFDPEKAKALLQQLQQFDEAIKKDWSRVLNKWQNLEPTWREPQYQQFRPIFDNLLATYNNAGKSCDNYIDFLKIQIKNSEEI